MRGSVLICLAALAACTGPETTHQPKQDEVEAIRQAEIDWAAAASAKKLASWEVFLAPNPTFVPPESPILVGRATVVDYYEGLFTDPNFAISCETDEVEIARSGEMAWSRGTCEATFTDETGIIQSNVGSRWVKVWEKQADGRWVGKINTWNYGI